MFVTASQLPTKDKFYKALRDHYRHIDQETGAITYDLEGYAFNLYSSLSQIMDESEKKSETIDALLRQNSELKAKLKEQNNETKKLPKSHKRQ